MAFSPDGRTVASGSEDNTLKLWDSTSGSMLHDLAGHTGRVFSVAFSPDGRTVASGSDDNTLKLWDVVTGRLLETLNKDAPKGNDVGAVAFVDGGRTLVALTGSFVTFWE